MGRSLLLVAALLLSSCSATDALVGPAGLDNYNAGVGFYGSGDRTQAEQQFRIALEKNPELAEAHLNLGLMYLENEDWDGGEQATRRAIEILERIQRTYVEGSTWQQALSLAYNNLGVAALGRMLQAAARNSASDAMSMCTAAKDRFRRALDLDASNSKARGNINRLTGVC